MKKRNKTRRHMHRTRMSTESLPCLCHPKTQGSYDPPETQENTPDPSSSQHTAYHRGSLERSSCSLPLSFLCLEKMKGSPLPFLRLLSRRLCPPSVHEARFSGVPSGRRIDQDSSRRAETISTREARSERKKRISAHVLVQSAYRKTPRKGEENEERNEERKAASVYLSA